MLSRLTAAITSAAQPGGAGLAEAVLNVTDTLVVVLDPQGRVLRFNPAAERLSGFSCEELRGQVLWPFVLPETDVAGVMAAFGALTAGDYPNRHENYWRTRSGELRYVLWSNTALLDARGRVALVVATGVDVTQEREERRARQESEERFRTLFEQSADGVVLIDPHDPEVAWRIVDCNEAFCHMNGYERHELIGQSIDRLHPYPMMAEEGAELFAWIREEGQVQGEGSHLHRDGTVFPVESASSVVTVGGRELILGQDRDIRERRRTEEQLRRLAAQLAHESQHDALTGLPNRTLLLDRLQVELRRVARNGRALAVVQLNLDGFRRVNDTLGHAVGDEVLRGVARRLQEEVRPVDTVARLGSDEFVVLIPDVAGPPEAAGVARRLRDALAQPLLVEGQPVNVRASVGVAVSPPDSSLPANLLRQADLAMTQAKRGGRGSVQVFQKSMDAAVHGQLHLETRLRHALASGGLHLHYQPQLDAGTGDLLGFEALVRWTDARLGLVAPARFVPLAEEAGLIGQLGAWVLDEACRQAAAWGLRVPIAVNVSALEVAQEDFTQRVHDTLRRHGLDGGQLKLEITERLTVQDLQRVARQLAQVQALGVQLSLDDFGTGQSSVSTLLQLPLNELKLDRSLITGVAESPIEQRVVGALIGLGRSLNLTVIVEGVETPGQLQALRELGCGAVQGYLVGRPGPASMWTPQLGGPLPLELPERGGAEGGEALLN
ncbi:putative bifunctional diguanylate cyclase/phosphodiesterase [Deinococcus kurensis]|uniref:putative bifunctional diguanylate cyclase/phosphodiesterase n=1 Tax=Deinococcus kurensis TaxID=2662757 RepID=UPI0012D36D2A|nr:bifunctional diguanylate cyclase/phosphodiesterase [Deinococcus kurensis]